MIYDVIIIGAGASGLFAASNIKLPEGKHGLILNKTSRPGLKLLMAGLGRCNLTHSGNIKEFTSHYGPSGSKIRSIIYKFSNDSVKDWFADRGLPLVTRGDGKIFPKTHSGRSVLNLLLSESAKNGFRIISPAGVTGISPVPSRKNDSPSSAADSEAAPAAESRNLWEITAATSSGTEKFTAANLIVAAGGCSYPSTGSDGSLLPVLRSLGIAISETHPSLVPIAVEDYPYTSLSGISVHNAAASIYEGSVRRRNSPSIQGGILMTHKNFSGPCILDISRWAEKGHTLEINWYPEKNGAPVTIHQITCELNSLRSGNRKQLITVLADYFSELTRAHIELTCRRAEADPSSGFAETDSETLKKILTFITSDRFAISGTPGFSTAMATRGGVMLSQISASTMECKEHPGLYIIGETLDVDGDTGGYNLQFAMSSAMRAAVDICSKVC